MGFPLSFVFETEWVTQLENKKQRSKQKIKKDKESSEIETLHKLMIKYKDKI